MVKAEWTGDTKWGAGLTLGVWSLLFLWYTASAIYQAHTDSGAQIARLKQSVANDDKSTAEKIENTKRECTIRETDNDGLRKQIHDQQDTINNCLLQLGGKQPLQVRSFPITSRGQRPGFPVMEYVLTTNITWTPIDLTANCDFPIADTNSTLMTESGGSTMIIDNRRISARQREIIISSPTWSPPTPLWVTVFFEGTVNRMPSCTFFTR